MISNVMNLIVLDREPVSTIRVEIDDFPTFIKLDPLDVLMAYMESCLEDGIDLGVNIHNLMNAHPYTTLKRKRKYKKGGEGTSNLPHPSLVKQPKKFETLKRILRSITTEASKDQRREVAEAISVVEATKVVKLLRLLKLLKLLKLLNLQRLLKLPRFLKLLKWLRLLRYQVI